MRMTLLALKQCQGNMSPPQKGKATAAPAASWPSASASWPSWQLLWQLPHPPLPSAAVKLSLLRPLSCQPCQNPTQRATRLTTSHEWLLPCTWWQILKHRVCSPAQPHVNPTPESCYLKDWVGDLCVLASPDVSLRPRQQTPLCMTAQLSSTLLYSNAAGMIMVPKLSFALTANYHSPRNTTARTSPIWGQLLPYTSQTAAAQCPQHSIHKAAHDITT